MPLVGFDRTTPVFEWAKRVHALDSAATVIGFQQTTRRDISKKESFIAIAMMTSN
jgi:hypothetical protein